MHNWIWRGLLLGMLALVACSKDDSGIPNVHVEFQVFMGDSQYASLMTPMGHAIVHNRGIAGILIYNTGFGYKAFDLLSTVNPEQGNQLIWDEESFSLRDPVSGALFDLATGMPTKSPGKKALKQYYVVEFGSNVLRITN